MGNERISRHRIAVVGGGVVGLSCAMKLSRHHDVTVVAADIGAASDSRNATAVWHVYLVPETEQVLHWAQRSLETFYELARQPSETGVELVHGVELFRRGAPQVPSWSHIPRVFIMLSEEDIASYNAARPDSLTIYELALLDEHPVKWGYRIEAPAADMARYLPWLERELRNRGVQMRRIHLSSLDELQSHFDVIVNCSGFGARELVGDGDFVPYKGQYFVLKRTIDSPRDYVGDDDHPGGMAYMIPRFGEVLVGGSAEKNVEDLQLTLEWSEVLNRAGLFVPWLRQCSQEDQVRLPVVGIRPCRTSGVRLEIDRLSASIPVIHNYGHGGSGFSLSWGCAEAVVDLLAQL